MKQVIEGFSTGAEALYVQTFWQSMMIGLAKSDRLTRFMQTITGNKAIMNLKCCWGCATHWRKSGQCTFAGAVLVLLMPLVQFKPFLFPNACTSILHKGTFAAKPKLHLEV
ncbi:MAG: hypothetical protein COB46_09055 [Rhodospirillaceae bacterium]|nr:MAG: hypothetical protein COB46_09055 [Rhodospirillaceae bacterium]